MSSFCPPPPHYQVFPSKTSQASLNCKSSISSNWLASGMMIVNKITSIFYFTSHSVSLTTVSSPQTQCHFSWRWKVLVPPEVSGHEELLSRGQLLALTLSLSLSLTSPAHDLPLNESSTAALEVLMSCRTIPFTSQIVFRSNLPVVFFSVSKSV